MIIIMAKDDDHDRGGNALCNRYYGNDKSQLAVFNRDCFTSLKSNRVTFLGHADSQKFGGYTPEEFVERLTDPRWGATLPKTVTDIDLIGCEIGFITQGNSYIHKVAQLLGDKGYELRVHAFSNLNAPADLAGMLVYVLDDGKAYVTGWTQQNSALVNSLEFQLKNIAIEKKSYDDEISSLKNEIFSLSSKSKVIELHQESIRENEKTIAELEKKTSSQNVSDSSTKEPVDKEKIVRKIDKLKKENENNLGYIQEIKREMSLITEKEKEISQLSTLVREREEKINELKLKLKTAQNEIVIISPSPLRETLDSSSSYQVVTKWTVPIQVTALPSIPSTSSPVPKEGAAFVYQEHRSWETQKNDPKWSKKGFSETKLSPPLLPPKFDDKSIKTEVGKKDISPDSKEEKVSSSPRFGKH